MSVVGAARSAIRSVAVLSLLFGTGPAAAATCVVTNVTPINFGAYSQSSTVPLDSVGELAVDCTTPSPVQIILGRGLSGRQTPREMLARGIALHYNLFMDAAHTVVWGDGTEGTQVFMGIAPAPQSLRLSIFGRMFALQAVPAGTYVDRIVVAVVF